MFGYKTLNTFVREYYRTDPHCIIKQLELLIAKNEQDAGIEDKEQVITLCTHLMFHLMKTHMNIVEHRGWKMVVEFVWGMLRGMNKETCIIDFKYGLNINRKIGFTGVTSKLLPC